MAEQPDPRALAEALQDRGSALFYGVPTKEQRQDCARLMLRGSMALAASQPSAVQGWRDITAGEVAQQMTEDGVGPWREVDAITLGAANKIASRRFAERASEVEVDPNWRHNALAGEPSEGLVRAQDQADAR